jgi:hypothetical protein
MLLLYVLSHIVLVYTLEHKVVLTGVTRSRRGKIREWRRPILAGLKVRDVCAASNPLNCATIVRVRRKGSL